MEEPPAAPRASWTEALVLGGIVIAVLLVLLGWGVIQPSPVVPPVPAGPQPAAPPQPVAEHARKVLERYFEGADLEEKLASVRDPARVRPMMEDYHLRRGHPFPTMGRVSPGKQVVMGERILVFFEVEPFRGPRFPVAVQWDGFRFAVDWESLTAYGTMDWREFVETKPEQAQTLRVYVSAAAEGMRPPGVAADRGIFRVEHRDHTDVLVAVSGPDTGEILAAKVKGRRVPMTLEMAWKDGVCEIRRIAAEGWSE
jgi:hypothetical protein